MGSCFDWFKMHKCRFLFINWRNQEMITGWLNQGTESSAKTEINKDTRGTFNQVYDWVVIHDFVIAQFNKLHAKKAKEHQRKGGRKIWCACMTLYGAIKQVQWIRKTSSVGIHPENSCELSLSFPWSKLIFKHLFIGEPCAFRNSLWVQTNKRAYFRARFSLLPILSW